MRLRLTGLLLLACLPTLSLAHEREVYLEGKVPTTFAHERDNLDVSGNAELIEDIKLQAGDPPATQNGSSEEGVETYGVSDSASLIEDVKNQSGDPATETASVADSSFDEIMEDIKNQSGDTPSTQAMIASSQQELDSLQTRIDIAYESDVAYLGADDKDALRTSQAAWKTFVISTCEVESERESGSITPVLNLTCQVRESQRRLDWLKDLP